MNSSYSSRILCGEAATTPNLYSQLFISQRKISSQSGGTEEESRRVQAFST
jgi:hypothetical protein